MRGFASISKSLFVEWLTTIVKADSNEASLWLSDVQWLQMYTISSNSLLSKEAILKCVH